MKVRPSFNDQPSENPGPGHYDINRAILLDHFAKNEGSFSTGPKDAMLKAASRNRVPGPGTYEQPGMTVHTYNRVYRGEIEPEYRADRIQSSKRLDVPGPGAYNTPAKKGEPLNLKIMSPQEKTKQYQLWVEKTLIKDPIGPQTYNPKGSELNKGIKMTQGGRDELKGSYKLSPPPGTYHQLGDFDFKDPNDRESVGRAPKFAFGSRTKIPDKSIDFPGPGTYTVQDLAPLNTKNVSFRIGKEQRKPLNAPNSHLMPGPGYYELNQPQSPQVGFTKGKRNFKLVKTDEPGPGSYEVP